MLMATQSPTAQITDWDLYGSGPASLRELLRLSGCFRTICSSGCEGQCWRPRPEAEMRQPKCRRSRAAHFALATMCSEAQRTGVTRYAVFQTSTVRPGTMNDGGGGGGGGEAGTPAPAAGLPAWLNTAGSM